MAQWYVKDLSKLTDVSVQTLHYYDRIDLLKPSIRLPNGYRIYSEKDLLQLQQIIALKFFGFELSQIKELLKDQTGALEHLAIQAKVLEQKANTLLEASVALKGIMKNVTDDKSIPWKNIIKLIEVYRMTQKLDHSWVKDIFTPEELKQYVDFETELKTNSTPEQKMEFEKSWANLVSEISDNLEQDPQSTVGITLGKKSMQWINGVYGKKYAHLRTKIFEQGLGEGKGLKSLGLTPEIVSWMDKAMDAYWRNRVYSILEKVGLEPCEVIKKLWDEVLDELYGNDAERKRTIYSLMLADENISRDAKAWIKKIAN